MKWYNSLIFKIILCSAVLTLCLIGSIFGVLYRYQQSILAEMEQRSSEIVEAIQVDLTNLDVEEVSRDMLERRLPDLKDRPGVDAIILYDSDKNVVTSIRPDEAPILGFGDPKAYVADIIGIGGRRTTRYLQTLPLTVGSKQVGYVRIMLDIVPQTHIVKALRSKILLSLLFLFLGTLAALCYFIVKLLQPLRAMATTCHEISEGNLHEIDIEPNASEVLVLEMKFNEMVRSLKTKAEMEKRLIQTQRLSALGNLAAGVAHEIGNPLNGIKLTMSHLKDIFSKSQLDKDSFDRYSDTILNEVNRLDRIVKDFLTLARERELSLCEYGVDRLLRETVDLIAKEAQERGVEIHLHLPADGPKIIMDPQLLKSAILNILINALEAAEGTGAVDITLTESDSSIVLDIVDRGRGIPPDIKDHIFDPYFSTKPVGTGLGLPLTKTIIEKHGGEITIDSGDGGGTAVTITIPTETGNL
jgi:signal transduction histidine kinase